MTRNLLIGSGLIGSAVAPHLDGYVLRNVPWNAYGPARDAIQGAIKILVRGNEPWRIIWCAGVSSVSSDRDHMGHETDLLDAALTAAKQAKVDGRFVLTSSAGGMFGGWTDARTPITEFHSPCPISEYGFGKWEQERLLTEWADATGQSYVIVRPTNVYGIRQNLSKPQGLISHLLRRIRDGEVLNLSVPTDTTRDYIYAPDAGRDIAQVATGRGIGVRLICSGRPTSIADILGYAHAVTGLVPETVDVDRDLMQPRHLPFKTFFPSNHPYTSVLHGMAAVWQHMNETDHQ
jgi:UDP-glucose 4-epimerase